MSLENVGKAPVSLFQRYFERFVKVVGSASSSLLEPTTKSKFLNDFPSTVTLHNYTHF